MLWRGVLQFTVEPPIVKHTPSLLQININIREAGVSRFLSAEKTGLNHLYIVCECLCCGLSVQVEKLQVRLQELSERNEVDAAVQTQATPPRAETTPPLTAVATPPVTDNTVQR